MGNTKKVAILAVLTALSMVLSLVESYIPIPVPAPGIKLGLANIVTIVTLVEFGVVSALTVSVVRCILVAVFFGAMSAILFSLVGGLSSCVLMWVFYDIIKVDFGMVGISIIGAATHNTAQILVAILLMKDTAIAAYLPVALICSVVTGFVVGFCSRRTLSIISSYHLKSKG